MKALAVLLLIVFPIIGIFVMVDKFQNGGQIVGVIGIVLAVVWLVFLFGALTFTSDATNADRAKQQYENEVVTRHNEVLQSWDLWHRGIITDEQYHAAADAFECWKTEQHQRLTEIESQFTNNISRFS